MGIHPKITGFMEERDFDHERDKRIFRIAFTWVKRVEGEKLGLWLHKNKEESNILRDMYEELGYRVGFIHKYSVVHNHLKTDNIIVSDGRPIFVDWKHAQHIQEVDENDSYSKFLDFSDSKVLLRTAGNVLKELDPKLTDELEKIYRERRKSELRSPLEVTLEELTRRAEQFVL
jgi:tRNA A-37 threonylcarbamoyl transferase component Bud32